MRNWGIKNKAPQVPASPLEENRNEKTKAEGAVGWGGGWAKGLLPCLFKTVEILSLAIGLKERSK